MARYQHAILNTARWESETIEEWLQYYIAIGFDHAYIYCNDDDPTEMYTTLRSYIESEQPFVTFHHMPYQGQQPSCWMHFFDHHKDECEWFMFVDADEFLAIKQTNNIKTFMSEREQHFDCIHFNWIWFGPGEHETRPQGSTLLNFTHREDQAAQMNFFTKTITRSSMVDPWMIGHPPIEMINHRWPPTVAASLREANVLGESMEEYFSDFHASAISFMEDRDRRNAILETACIYHYLFRSRADFKRRVDRGTLGSYYFQPRWGALAGRTEEFNLFLSYLSAKEDRYLAEYWQGQLSLVSKRAWRTSLVQPPEGTNLALSSTPTQSSVSPWSTGDVHSNARGAINGQHTGTDGFHTALEEKPWWKTDLGCLSQISEIRVFNSLKNTAMAGRAFPLVVETSQDGEIWQLLFKNPGHSPFGGADGHPLIIRTDRSARFVKLSLLSTDFFHLDEIEIYGKNG